MEAVFRGLTQIWRLSVQTTGDILQLNDVQNAFKLFAALSSNKSQSTDSYTMPLKKMGTFIVPIFV
jgi:hypothetical protein